MSPVVVLLLYFVTFQDDQKTVLSENYKQQYIAYVEVFNKQ